MLLGTKAVHNHTRMKRTISGSPSLPRLRCLLVRMHAVRIVVGAAGTVEGLEVLARCSENTGIDVAWPCAAVIGIAGEDVQA